MNSRKNKRNPRNQTTVFFEGLNIYIIDGEYQKVKNLFTEQAKQIGLLKIDIARKMTLLRDKEFNNNITHTNVKDIAE